MSGDAVNVLYSFDLPPELSHANCGVAGSGGGSRGDLAAHPSVSGSSTPRPLSGSPVISWETDNQVTKFFHQFHQIESLDQIPWWRSSQSFLVESRRSQLAAEFINETKLTLSVLYWLFHFSTIRHIFIWVFINYFFFFSSSVLLLQFYSFFSLSHLAPTIELGSVKNHILVWLVNWWELQLKH